jgi:hypothetical protein
MTHMCIFANIWEGKQEENSPISCSVLPQAKIKKSDSHPIQLLSASHLSRKTLTARTTTITQLLSLYVRLPLNARFYLSSIDHIP